MRNKNKIKYKSVLLKEKDHDTLKQLCKMESPSNGLHFTTPGRMVAHLINKEWNRWDFSQDNENQEEKEEMNVNGNSLNQIGFIGD